MRARLLPQARRVDTGFVIISGKLTLTPEVRPAIPPTFLLGPTLILGPPGTFMFANAVEYPDRPAGAPPADEGEEYVMWGFSARRTHLGLAGEPERLRLVQKGLAIWFFCHMRKPPRKALSLLPRRAPGGSFFSFLLFPPPSTT